MNQLGKAKVQPEILTPFDKKGHLIGEKIKQFPIFKPLNVTRGYPIWIQSTPTMTLELTLVMMLLEQQLMYMS